MQENWCAQYTDMNAQNTARKKWDSVAKPLYALGLLEDLVAQIAGIQETADVSIDKRCALVFCGDHGVTAEGVSQSTSEVTALVAQSVAEGTANINLMTKDIHVDVFAVDMGMMTDVDHPAILRCKQAYGTNNMVHGPAMTRQQAENAVKSGIQVIGKMKEKGYKIALVGEMGIGNTTPSSAMASLFLDKSVEEMTGRGAGLSDDGLIRKVKAIKEAIRVNQPDKNDPMDVLSKVGGYDIAGMAGAYLGGMIYRMPVISDGMIPNIAALTAVRLCPAARDFIMTAHISREPSDVMMVKELGKDPIIHADMALGEGTGAAMLLPLLDMALNVYNGVHTFDHLGIDAYVPLGGENK